MSVLVSTLDAVKRMPLNWMPIKEKTLLYICSYLKNRRQFVKGNFINSNFLTITSGVPQGTIVGPILFNIFFNDFFFFMYNMSAHSSADDNTLSCFSKTVKDLVTFIESESACSINWLRDNSMIVNSNKFQAILLDERKCCFTIKTVFRTWGKVCGCKRFNLLKFELLSPSMYVIK